MPGSRAAQGPQEERSVDEEEALLAAVAAGDHAALGRLYDVYAPLLLGIGQRMLGQRRESEDLVHDVFLEIWRRAHTYDASRGSVRTWILLRTRSRALDRLKSVGHARTTSLDGTAQGPEGLRDDSPQEDADRLPDHRALHLALRALPVEQRQVLELGYFEGLSSMEIAGRLQLPIGTVKSRVAAALSKLRGALRVGDPA